MSDLIRALIAPFAKGVYRTIGIPLLLCRSLRPFFLFVLVAGCTSENGYRHYAGAVGPDLYSRQTVNNTSLLNAYTASICTQAGLATGGRCTISTVADWKDFVDMGLYDIDQRCDTFLDRLYYKDKSNEPILAQISDTRSFTAAILDATKSSSVAISIVAAAFDLTESTFRNARGSLLEALDPTTVKSIVFRRQQEVKKQIYSTTISSKPQALHALRTYLRVCMPFTIEMEANAVLTTVQRTGEVGKSPITFDSAQFRESLKSTPGTKADTPPIPDNDPGKIRAPNDMGPFEEDTSPSVHRRFAKAICVPGIADSTLDFGPEGSSTRQAIKIWESGLVGFLPSGVVQNGSIDTAVEDRYMRQVIVSGNRYRCDSSAPLAKTAYEAAVFVTADERIKWQRRIVDYLKDIEDEGFGLSCGARQGREAFEAVLSKPENNGVFGTESRKALTSAKACLLASGQPIHITNNDEFEPALQNGLQ